MSLDAQVFPQLWEVLSYYLSKLFVLFTLLSLWYINFSNICSSDEISQITFVTLSSFFSALIGLFQNPCPLIYLLCFLSLHSTMDIFYCNFHFIHWILQIQNFFVLLHDFFSKYVILFMYFFFPEFIEWSFWVFLQFIEFLLNSYFECFIINVMHQSLVI